MVSTVLQRMMRRQGTLTESLRACKNCGSSSCEIFSGTDSMARAPTVAHALMEGLLHAGIGAPSLRRKPTTQSFSCPGLRALMGVLIENKCVCFLVSFSLSLFLPFFVSFCSSVVEGKKHRLDVPERGERYLNFYLTILSRQALVSNCCQAYRSI